MPKYVFLLLLNLLLQIHSQNCSSLYVDAIYPCTIHFQLDSTTNSCLLSSCTTNSPGTEVNQNNTNVCFVSCCPGFRVPSLLSRDNLMECYNQFNHKPSLVNIIGGLFGALVIASCVILPCCTNKACPLSRFKQKINQILSGRRQRGNSRQPQKLQRKSQMNSPVKSLLQMSKLSLEPKSNFEQEPVAVALDFDVIIQEKEEGGSSSQNVCLLCSKQNASCRLLCGHFYHLECIAVSWQHLNCCPLCEKKEIFPLTYFCQKCFKVGIPRSSLAQPSEPFVCGSCK